MKFIQEFIIFTQPKETLFPLYISLVVFGFCSFLFFLCFATKSKTKMIHLICIALSVSIFISPAILLVCKTTTLYDYYKVDVSATRIASFYDSKTGEQIIEIDLNDYYIVENDYGYLKSKNTNIPNIYFQNKYVEILDCLSGFMTSYNE